LYKLFAQGTTAAKINEQGSGYFPMVVIILLLRFVTGKVLPGVAYLDDA
jgi:hypothetical protein